MLFLVVAFVVVADVESGGGFEAVGRGVSCFVSAEYEFKPVDPDVEQSDGADSFKCKGLSQGKIGTREGTFIIWAAIDDRPYDSCSFVPSFYSEFTHGYCDFAAGIDIKLSVMSAFCMNFDAGAAGRVVFLCEDVGVSDWMFVCEESGDVDDPYACRQSQEADQGGEDFPAFLHRFCLSLRGWRSWDLERRVCCRFRSRFVSVVGLSLARQLAFTSRSIAALVLFVCRGL